MTVPLVLFEDEPRARRTDPETSHAAADLNDTARSRKAVLLILQAYGRPLTDDEIRAIHRDAGGNFSDSRLRTARHELVERGVVHMVPDREGVSDMGGRAKLWTLTSHAA